MSQRPLDILQRIYNEIDTAETAWQLYKAASIPEFDAAYELHKNALAESQKAIQSRVEQAWQVLNFLLSVGLGAWVPRLLGPVGSGTDGLTSSWVQTTLKQLVTDDINSAIKGTTLEKLKQLAVPASTSSFEPVVEKTVVWGSRLEEGILGRSKQLKDAINEHIQNPGRWNEKAALAMEQRFRTLCPFIADKPRDTGVDFKRSFRAEAELEMWATWALERNKKWWMDNRDHRDLWDMYPIMDRMFALGVNKVADWHPGRRSATIGGTWIRPGYLLNMVKMIDWAEKRRQDATTCRLPAEIPNFLRVRQPATACHPTAAH